MTLSRGRWRRGKTITVAIQERAHYQHLSQQLRGGGFFLDFVTDHEALYNKTNEHFKDQARDECLLSSSPKVVGCLSRCARPGLNCKGNVT